MDSDFTDVDIIYINHIHPDRFAPNTLAGLSKKIPVLILNCREKFLKNNLVRPGFSVIEIANGETYNLGQDVALTIFAADNCDPEVCQKHFGCLNLYSISKGNGTAQIDSLCTISEGKMCWSTLMMYHILYHLMQSIESKDSLIRLIFF